MNPVPSTSFLDTPPSSHRSASPDSKERTRESKNVEASPCSVATPERSQETPRRRSLRIQWRQNSSKNRQSATATALVSFEEERAKKVNSAGGSDESFCDQLGLIEFFKNIDYDCISPKEYQSDVIFLVNDIEIHAHKVMCAYASTTFRDLFDGHPRQMHFIIHHTTPQAFKELIRFIYNGIVCGVRLVAKDLLRLSDKYGLNILKGYCEFALLGTLIENNAVDYFELAVTYEAVNLRIYAINFIHRNKDSSVIRGNITSLAMRNPHLAGELLYKL